MLKVSALVDSKELDASLTHIVVGRLVKAETITGNLTSDIACSILKLSPLIIRLLLEVAAVFRHELGEVGTIARR